MHIRLASAADLATLQERLNVAVAETLKARAAEGLSAETLSGLRGAMACMSVRVRQKREREGLNHGVVCGEAHTRSRAQESVMAQLRFNVSCGDAAEGAENEEPRALPALLTARPVPEMPCPAAVLLDERSAALEAEVGALSARVTALREAVPAALKAQQSALCASLSAQASATGAQLAAAGVEGEAAWALVPAHTGEQLALSLTALPDASARLEGALGKLQRVVTAVQAFAPQPCDPVQAALAAVAQGHTLAQAAQQAGPDVLLLEGTTEEIEDAEQAMQGKPLMRQLAHSMRYAPY